MLVAHNRVVRRSWCQRSCAQAAVHYPTLKIGLQGPAPASCGIWGRRCDLTLVKTKGKRPFALAVIPHSPSVAGARPSLLIMGELLALKPRLSAQPFMTAP